MREFDYWIWELSNWITELSNWITELSNQLKSSLFMCTIRERTNSFETLCNWINELSYSIKELSNTANTPQIEKCWNKRALQFIKRYVKQDSSLIQLERSLIELESSVIELANSLIQLKSFYMYTIRKRTNSFETLCNWINELSYSIKELSNTAYTPAIWKNVGNRELSNSFKNTLHKRAL